MPQVIAVEEKVKCVNFFPERFQKGKHFGVEGCFFSGEGSSAYFGRGRRINGKDLVFIEGGILEDCLVRFFFFAVPCAIASRDLNIFMLNGVFAVGILAIKKIIADGFEFIGGEWVNLPLGKC